MSGNRLWSSAYIFCVGVSSSMLVHVSTSCIVIVLSPNFSHLRQVTCRSWVRVGNLGPQGCVPCQQILHRGSLLPAGQPTSFPPGRHVMPGASLLHTDTDLPCTTLPISPVICVVLICMGTRQSTYDLHTVRQGKIYIEGMSCF